MARILLVEDTKDIQNVVLLATHQICEIDVADCIERARQFLLHHLYAQMIVDIGLPDGSGLHLCSEVKNSEQHRASYLTVLSGSRNLIDKVTGFQLGIDEFLQKPIDHRELRARVESRLKKSGSAVAGHPNQLSCGNFHLDALLNRVSIEELDGEAVRSNRQGLSCRQKHEITDLTVTEFRILWALCQARGGILSRDQLLSSAWGAGHFGTDRSIDIHICEIRKKLGKASCQIKTIYGCGYRFEPATRIN